jgi:hypothetical protein
MATSGYLVEVEKLDPAEMEGWRTENPEAFARALDTAQYEPAYGLKANARIEGGE